MAKEEATAYIMIKAAGKFRHLRPKNVVIRHLTPSEAATLLEQSDDAQRIREGKK